MNRFRHSRFSSLARRVISLRTAEGTPESDRRRGLRFGFAVGLPWPRSLSAWIYLGLKLAKRPSRYPEGGYVHAHP